MKLRLYSYFRSSSAYRVRIALNLKGLPHEIIPVHLLKNEQQSSEHKVRNPTGQIPSLEVDGKFLNQSMAILFYLDEIEKSAQLFPKDPFHKSKVIEICELINSGIQPLQNLAVLNALVDRYDISNDQKTEWGKYWNERGLASLEILTAQTAGKFAFGNELTAADCFIQPQLYSAYRFNVDFSNMPTLSRLEQEYAKLESFKFAHPDAQLDSPK